MTAEPMGEEPIDAVVVGAGFAGLYMLYRLRTLGLSTRAYEQGSGVGGTWFWNRYPGARCDVESMEYSYQFSADLQQEWQWTERYASQPEILAYLEHVADRFDLRRDIRFETRVERAAYDEQSGRWHVDASDGSRVSAKFVVLATGCLSTTNMPALPGLDTYEGQVFHTGRWPHEGVSFAGRNVAVIGTGSSAIQAIPLIAEEAAHLHVFQRTPNFSVPARNRPLEPEEILRIKQDYPELRRMAGQMPFGFNTRSGETSALEVSEAERLAEYEARWQSGGLPFMAAYADLLTSKEANDTAAEFVRDKIRGIVKDPEIASALTPHTTVGCKRLCSDSGYFETFNRPNVTLVDVNRSPIERVTPKGLRAGGVDYTFDAIVFATGFDAMTGAVLAIDIRGRDGLSLREKWSHGPRTYLGLATAGFPNLFLITGPGSPSVLSNMVPSIEQHVNWISDCISNMQRNGANRIEAEPAAEDAWVDHVNEVASMTLYPTCNSWYLGSNVPGKPRVFMPYLGFPEYVAKTTEVVDKGYEGFRLSS
jgi:cation diffusion facilitator CzcD-associated flavoprotein CzcO